MDFLSEREMACSVGVTSRQKLWDYFDLSDPDTVSGFLSDGWIGIYGKSDPLARASDREN